MLRKCKQCGETKPLEYFAYSKFCKYNKRHLCKQCHSDNIQRYKRNNVKNGKCKQCGKPNNSKYPRCEKCRKRQQSLNTQREKEDISYKIKVRLRQRISQAVRRKILNNKAGSAIHDLGCTIEELIIYLEAQFKDGMTWDNYGDWHIDHIIPLSSVDLSNREDFLKVAHYTNLQPLWAEENLKKYNKM
jgi:hypothetical protein